MAYWVGPGVFTYQEKGKDGKISTRDIVPGEELPSSIDKVTIKSLIEKGKAANKAPDVPKANDESVALRAQIAELSDQLAQAKQGLARVDELEGQLAEAQKTIEALTGQLTGGGAGPEKGKGK